MVARPWEALPPAVAVALRPFVPATAEEIIDAIRAAVPAYARPLEGAFGQAIRTGVERALSEFLDDIEGAPGRREGTPSDTYATLGRWELREGRTMEALLAAYRVGARVAWRRTAAAGREVGFDADTLSLLAEAFFAYIDELSARSAQGFVEAQSELAGEVARRRRTLLALLIQSPPADQTAIETTAREARWELPATLAALVWRDQSDQPVAHRLPLGSLSGPLDDGLVCALVPDAAAPGRLEELSAALDGRPAALGSPVRWQDCWQSAGRARALHRLVTERVLGEESLAVADDHLADLAVHADPALARDIAELALAPLRERPPVSRRRLLETLSAWLDHQGRVPQVADALHVHPQTVRYRVRQLRELFGDALDDPTRRFELSLAVRAAARVQADHAPARAPSRQRPRRAGSRP